MNRAIAPLLAAALAAGCAAEGGRTGDRPMRNIETGAILGAVGGAVIGAAAYRKNRTKGALVGAVGGGLAGGAAGAYMDAQKQDLEKRLAAEIQNGEARVDKLPNDVVRVTMTNRTAFAVNSADIRPAFRGTMDKIAGTVIRYGKTTLTIVGHTDNTGSNDYNQKLSERRAQAVAEFFDAKNVNPLRLAVSGKGETEPVASNRTEAGRELNRRVEIYVEPIVDG